MKKNIPHDFHRCWIFIRHLCIHNRAIPRLLLAVGMLFAASAQTAVTDDGKPGLTNYVVIDLSAGADATSYPVFHLDTMPNSIPDDYRTTKLVLKKITAGNFTMGSPSGEIERDPDEMQHRVTLTKDFYIGVFEVTQKQW